MTILSSTTRLPFLLLIPLCGCSSEQLGAAREEPPQAGDIWPSPGLEEELTDGDEKNPWLSEWSAAGEMGEKGEEDAKSPSSPDAPDQPEAPETSEPDAQDPMNAEPPARAPLARFERYKEGSGADKLLHLSLLGNVPALDCRLEIYANGGTKVWRTLVLPTPWEPGVELVVCTATEPDARCNVALSGSGYNGNDALVLRCGELVIDRFGRVGEDPGTAWTHPTLKEITSKDAELLRCGVPSSSTNSTHFDAFSIGDHWVRLRPDEPSEEALQRCPASENLGGAAGGL